MTARTERTDSRRARARAFAIALVPLAVVVAVRTAVGADINVVLDQARIVRLPERVGTIVVGNPLIADVSVQAGGIMVITGKGYGTTNVVALDRSGKTLMESEIQVRGPRDKVIVVHRGVERESYSCAPTCERRITLGDAPQFFDAAVGQAGTRNGMAGGVGTQQAR